MATIRDVAKLAGVSIKTVSRVLNKEPHVRPELSDKVGKAIDSLAYQPSQAARRIRGSKSHIVVLLCEYLNVGYVGRLQVGAVNRARELDYFVVVEMANRFADALTVANRLIVQLRPDGFILCPPFSDNGALIALLQDSGIAAIKISGFDKQGGINIFTDEQAAAYAMTQHLVDQGHAAIAIVRGHPDHRAAGLRFDGFVRCMRDNGLPIPVHHVAQGYFDIASGLAAGRALLSHRDKPTAVFALNDEMALGVMMAARELGLDVPRDLSVAGFDNSQEGEKVWPRLTTVHQPVEDMGGLALDILAEGKVRFRHESLPFSVILRESTQKPA